MTERPHVPITDAASTASPQSAVGVGAPDGADVPSYGDVGGEFASLRHSMGPHGPSGGAIIVDRSSRSRGTFGGNKAGEVLNGLVTNDVLSLTAGTGCYAAALTAKGRIIADARIFVRGGDILVDVPPRAAAGWWAMIRKYVNPRLARYADISADTADLSVYGTRSHAVVAAAIGLPWETLGALGEYMHLTVEAFSHSITVARVPDIGVEGFTLFLPRVAREVAWETLVTQGARPAGADALAIARIESGRPEWGIEIDDSTLAQEANMDEWGAISYTKGCYTGQETVARVHFRGHVNRQLRGLRYDEEHPVPAGGELHDATGKVVGDVRSAVISPRLGGIALAMVRREVGDETEVEIVWGAGRVTARVVALPFPPG